MFVVVVLGPPFSFLSLHSPSAPSFADSVAFHCRLRCTSTHLLRPALTHTTNRHLLQTANETREMTVHLVVGLVSREADLQRVLDDDIVSRVDYSEL